MARSMLDDSPTNEQGPIPIDSAAPSTSDQVSNSAASLKSAHRKMDFRLVAWYAVGAFVFTMGAHNLTNAAIMNTEGGTDIQHQLGNLTSEQWAIALSAGHYSQLVFEPFSAFLLKRFSPRKWMAPVMVLWGAIATCNGAVSNFAGLFACRFFLGLAQGGLFPGVMYHLSFWYPASTLPLRLASLTASVVISGALSGLFAYAISPIDGKAGLSGWQWLFIIEGIPAVLFGIATFFFLPEYPTTATFLTESERQEVLAALPPTQPKSQDNAWNWQQMKGVLKDPTTYTFCLIWMCHATGSEGMGTALPNVMLGLGMLGQAQTQLLTIPPFVAGACVALLVAWLVRTHKLRSWVAASSLEAFCCMCYVVLMCVQNAKVKYLFIVLASASAVGVTPIIWPERIQAVSGTTGAAFAIGLTSSMSLLHGVAGPQIWQKKFGPSYNISYAVSMGLLAGVVVSILTTWLILRRRQKKDAELGREKEIEAVERHDSAQSAR